MYVQESVCLSVDFITHITPTGWLILTTCLSCILHVRTRECVFICGLHYSYNTYRMVNPNQLLYHVCYMYVQESVCLYVDFITHITPI